MANEDSVSANREVARIDSTNLLLDAANPRFGTQDPGRSQTELLDHIVQQFGVDDVLSSLVVNGYFEAEPVVCRRQADSSTCVVMEGNRRLAACLILLEDQRARHQERRKAQFKPRWHDHTVSRRSIPSQPSYLNQTIKKRPFSPTWACATSPLPSLGSPIPKRRGLRRWSKPKSFRLSGS